MTTTSTKGTALITGASTGIGAIYADRLAKRGYNLILVARNGERLRRLSDALSAATGREIASIVADLTDKFDLARVEEVLARMLDEGGPVSEQAVRTRLGCATALSEAAQVAVPVVDLRLYDALLEGASPGSLHGFHSGV